MQVRILLVAALAAGASPIAGAERPLETSPFEGLWQVVPNPPRFARGPGQRGARSRPAGTEADQKGLTRGDYRIRGMMTASGQAAFDQFDPLDHPANNCISPGLPSIAMTPNLQEWRFENAQLRIIHEYYSTKRTIHLEAEAPEDHQHSAAGFGSGRLEGDTLVITTTHLAPTLGGLSRNAPSSDARVVTERYRVLRDGEAMQGQMTIEDSKFLVRPVRLEVRLRRPEDGAELVLFPCSVEAARRHLNP